MCFFLHPYNYLKNTTCMKMMNNEVVVIPLPAKSIQRAPSAPSKLPPAVRTQVKRTKCCF